MMRTAIVPLLLLAMACASAPPAKAPPWTAIPPGIVNAICERLATERAATDSTVAIVVKTEPLISGAALRALGHEYKRSAPIPVDLAASALPMPVTLEGASCGWRPIESIDPARHVATPVVQLSRPIVNPFQRTEAGVFARFSIGGRDAQWYWIPLAERKGQWLVGYVMPLAVME